MMEYKKEPNGEVRTDYNQVPVTANSSPKRPKFSRLPEATQLVPPPTANIQGNGSNGFQKGKLSTSSSKDSDDYIIPEARAGEEIYQNDTKTENHSYLRLCKEPQEETNQSGYQNCQQDRTSQIYVNVDKEADPEYDYATFNPPSAICASAMKAQVPSPAVPSAGFTKQEAKTYVNLEPDNQCNESNQIYNNTYLAMDKKKRNPVSLYKMRRSLMKKVTGAKDTRKDTEPSYFDMSGKHRK